VAPHDASFDLGYLAEIHARNLKRPRRRARHGPRPSRWSRFSDVDVFLKPSAPPKHTTPPTISATPQRRRGRLRNQSTCHRRLNFLSVFWRKGTRASATADRFGTRWRCGSADRTADHGSHWASRKPRAVQADHGLTQLEHEHAVGDAEKCSQLGRDDDERQVEQRLRSTINSSKIRSR